MHYMFHSCILRISNDFVWKFRCISSRRWQNKYPKRPLLKTSSCTVMCRIHQLINYPLSLMRYISLCWIFFYVKCGYFCSCSVGFVLSFSDILLQIIYWELSPCALLIVHVHRLETYLYMYWYMIQYLLSCLHMAYRPTVHSRRILVITDRSELVEKQSS